MRLIRGVETALSDLDADRIGIVREIRESMLLKPTEFLSDQSHLPGALRLSTDFAAARWPGILPPQHPAFATPPQIARATALSPATLFVFDPAIIERFIRAARQRDIDQRTGNRISTNDTDESTYWLAADQATRDQAGSALLKELHRRRGISESYKISTLPDPIALLANEARLLTAFHNGPIAALNGQIAQRGETQNTALVTGLTERVGSLNLQTATITAGFNAYRKLR